MGSIHLCRVCELYETYHTVITDIVLGRSCCLRETMNQVIQQVADVDWLDIQVSVSFPVFVIHPGKVGMGLWTFT